MVIVKLSNKNTIEFRVFRFTFQYGYSKTGTILSLKISKENFLILCSLTEKSTLTIEIKYKVIVVNSFKHTMLII